MRDKMKGEMEERMKDTMKEKIKNAMKDKMRCSKFSLEVALYPERHITK